MITIFTQVVRSSIHPRRPSQNFKNRAKITAGRDSGLAEWLIVLSFSFRVSIVSTKRSKWSSLTSESLSTNLLLWIGCEVEEDWKDIWLTKLLNFEIHQTTFTILSSQSTEGFIWNSFHYTSLEIITIRCWLTKVYCPLKYRGMDVYKRTVTTHSCSLASIFFFFCWPHLDRIAIIECMF